MIRAEDSPLVVSFPIFGMVKAQGIQEVRVSRPPVLTTAVFLDPAGSITLWNATGNTLIDYDTDTMRMMRVLHESRGERLDPWIGPKGFIPSKLAVFQYEHYRLAQAGPHPGTHCVSFRAFLTSVPPRFRRMVYGQACAAEPFSEEVLKESFSRIGVKGIFAPPAS